MCDLDVFAVEVAHPIEDLKDDRLGEDDELNLAWGGRRRGSDPKGDDGMWRESGGLEELVEGVGYVWHPKAQILGPRG